MLRFNPAFSSQPSFLQGSAFQSGGYLPVDLGSFLQTGDIFQGAGSGQGGAQDYLQLMQVQMLAALLMQLDPATLIQLALMSMLNNNSNRAGGSDRGRMGGGCFSNQRSVAGGWNGSDAPSGAPQLGAVDGPGGPAQNLHATVDRVRNSGARNQMIEGRITVNGHTYNYRSGGHGAGNLPMGQYSVSAHMWNRGNSSMNVGGVGYSFALSNKYDPRVGRVRGDLRIHPDGGTPGTIGCMGIVGNATTQAQFRRDMAAELQRNGGHVTLNVG